MKIENNNLLDNNSLLIDNEILNARIERYRLTHEKKEKEEIHKMIFPLIERVVRSRFANVKCRIDDLLQVAGLVVNEYVEDSSYDPTKGGSFYAYVIRKILGKCWAEVYFYQRPISLNEKSAIHMNSFIKKMRVLNPDVSDEELVQLYTEQTFAHSKYKNFEKKYIENLELFNVSKSNTFVRSLLQDGHEIFDNISSDSWRELDDARGEIIDVCFTAMEMQKLTKKHPCHLTTLEGNAFLATCLNVLLYKDFTDEELATKMGHSAQAFSRALGQARSKVCKYAKSC